jgi:hypothetical protein
MGHIHEEYDGLAIDLLRVAPKRWSEVVRRHRHMCVYPRRSYEFRGKTPSASVNGFPEADYQCWLGRQQRGDDPVRPFCYEFNGKVGLFRGDLTQSSELPSTICDLVTRE